MERDLPVRMERPLSRPRALFAAMAIVIASTGSALGEDNAAAALNDGTIGYVLTGRYWAVYQTPGGKTECPQGMNDGPREQYKLLYPEDGKKRTLLETHLERESEVWFPSTSKEPYPFYEPQGKIAIGLNLDGKIGANDFISPDGEEGIDNQLYRVTGCVAGYRGA